MLGTTHTHAIYRTPTPTGEQPHTLQQDALEHSATGQHLAKIQHR